MIPKKKIRISMLKTRNCYLYFHLFSQLLHVLTCELTCETQHVTCFDIISEKIKLFFFHFNICYFLFIFIHMYGHMCMWGVNKIKKNCFIFIFSESFITQSENLVISIHIVAWTSENFVRVCVCRSNIMSCTHVEASHCHSFISF